MWNDPIVEEIHAVRKRLWDEAGGDLHEVIRRARARHDPARVVVRGEPKRPQTWQPPQLNKSPVIAPEAAA